MQFQRRLVSNYILCDKESAIFTSPTALPVTWNNFIKIIKGWKLICCLPLFVKYTNIFMTYVCVIEACEIEMLWLSCGSLPLNLFLLLITVRHICQPEFTSTLSEISRLLHITMFFTNGT